MDTNKMRDFSREQFEKFALSAEGGLFAGHLAKGEDGEYLNYAAQCYWLFWQASRAAVVVELPSACAYEGLTEHLGSVIELTYEAPEHDPVGLARLPDVRAAIEAQGLRVAP
ncbi:hypothetical protein A3K88_02810 [Pseudomonas putida]|nr:hypothetical protein A3K88_02810 [Pseudomonas putida]QEQ88691.1 hypothetical protein F1602_15785 [Pseudomonas putida]